MKIIILRGDEKTLEQWHEKVVSQYQPWHYYLMIPQNENSLPKALLHKPAIDGKLTLYYCDVKSCHPAITDPEEIAQWVIPKKT